MMMRTVRLHAGVGHGDVDDGDDGDHGDEVGDDGLCGPCDVPGCPGACLDVVVKELPIDLNCTFHLHNGEPVNPHARRPYAGHGAHTVGGGVVRWPARERSTNVPLPLTQSG